MDESNKTLYVRCRVTGHSDGPPCEDCGALMDSLVVEEACDFLQTDQAAAYCPACFAAGKGV